VLDSGTTTAGRTVYHRAILRALGIDAPLAALLAELEAPAAGPVAELFPEVRRVLERLRAAGVGMAVVSDASAGLEAIFCSLDIDRYFQGGARPWHQGGVQVELVGDGVASDRA
jgi:putative hydrolase of the HAD superfamily